MDTDFTFELRTSYAHVQIVTGFKITLESTTRLWTELQAFCQTHQCRFVLCEGVNPSREMAPKDFYKSGLVAAQKLLGLAVAFHWEGYRTDHITDIFKSVAHNKGAAFAFFETRAEALEWLGVSDATTE
jgi:hypothetical protein